MHPKILLLVLFYLILSLQYISYLQALLALVILYCLSSCCQFEPRSSTLGRPQLDFHCDLEGEDNHEIYPSYKQKYAQCRGRCWEREESLGTLLKSIIFKKAGRYLGIFLLAWKSGAPRVHEPIPENSKTSLSTAVSPFCCNPFVALSADTISCQILVVSRGSECEV